MDDYFSTPSTTAEDIGVVSTGTDRNTQWQGCCKFAVNLHRQPADWDKFKAELQSGYQVREVGDQRLVAAALALVADLAEAGVRRWDFLPAPSEADLAEPEAWAARRLAERRREQDDAEADRRWQQRQARAFGQRPPGNGTVNPVHLQRSKHSLEELGRRLQWVIAQHQAAGREFKREFLDNRSDYYIDVAGGGVANKQVTIMACEITGVRERRDFDDSWNIVMDWLRERQVKAA